MKITLITFLALSLFGGSVLTAASGTLSDNGSTVWVYIQMLDSETPLPRTVAAQGDYGGGTLTLEWSLDASTATTATDSAGDIARTAASLESFYGRGVYLRWTLSGTTTPPDIDWLIED